MSDLLFATLNPKPARVAMAERAVGAPWNRAHGKQKVYFIGSLTGGPIKIGWTTGSARKRLEELQTGNPYRLSVFVTVPGGRRLEKQLHSIFADDRLRGEWFTDSDDLKELIRSLRRQRAIANRKPEEDYAIELDKLMRTHP